MDEEITDRITHYLLHDPIGNVEGMIEEYDPEKLQSAEDQGAVFIAVYESGRRELVKAADIVEPQPVMNGIVLVQPVYVDDRMKAVCNVFDALDSEMTSGHAANAGIATMALVSDQPETFHDALVALKALVYGEEVTDGDA